MWYAMKRGWMAVGMAAVCALSSMAAELPPLNIPVCDKPPMLDGVLNDSEWQSAEKIESLYQIDSDAPAPETSLRLMRDNAWLYIAADCRNPHLQHAEQLAFKHDEAVNRDDSVEIFLRPTSGAEDPYYHFILSCYGVRAEQRCNAIGARDRAWDTPWRSAVQRAADGWTAEIAIPLSVFNCDDLSALEINIGRNFMEVGLDAAGAITSQKTLNHMLRPDNKGSFHSFANFQKTSGMAGFKPEVLFVPTITGADITGLVQEDGKVFYELALVLDIATSAPGAAMLKIIEDCGDGETVALSQPVELNGMLPLQLKIALNDFCQRKVKIVLADTETNNLLADRMVEDTSRIRVIRRAFVGRSYYTTEELADIHVELSLPDTMLARAKLVFAIDGKSIASVEQLRSVMTTQLPVSALALGDNSVALQLFLDQKNIAEQTLQVIRLDPRPGCEVQADFIRGVVLKNKKPVFPIGLFGHTLQCRLGEDGCTDDEEYLFKFLAEDIGFDTLVRSRRARNLAAFVKLAEKYGMDVITWSYPQADTYMNRIKGAFREYDLEKLVLPEHIQQAMKNDKEFWTGKDGTLNQADRQVFCRALYELAEPQAIEEAKLLRDSKNFLAYYSVDEPNLENPELRVALAEWYWKSVYSVDPWHPHLLVYSAHIPAGEKWTKWGDVLGFDIYPKLFRADAGIRIEPGLSTVYYAWQLRERCRSDNKIMWFVPISNIQDPCRTPIGMDKSRMLCQAYAAIIYGVKGLLYFGLSNTIGEDAWDALRTICAQVKAMKPALVHGDVQQNIKYIPDNLDPSARKFPMVNAAVFKYPDGDYLLMAVNIRPHAVDTTFKVGGLQHAVRMFVAEDQSDLALDGESFNDKIEPYGVRAYRIKISEQAVPVQVTVSMTPIEDERAQHVDLITLVRQVMEGKNYMPNPCFERQFLPGVPDFFRPFFEWMTDVEACKPGSSWFVDREVLWNGKPSLKVTRKRWQDCDRPTVYGSLGSYYPPMPDKPHRLTFSFYARTADTNALFIIRSDSSDPTARQTIKLQPTAENEWRRYHMTFNQTPGNGRNMGARLLQMIPREDTLVWISGLQMELGEEPTEFQDDGVIVKKKVIADDPDNLLVNPGAECGTAEGWDGLENMRRGEFGIRRGMGRTGDYAFCWRGQSPGIQSDWITIDTNKTYALSGWFKAESGAITGVTFGVMMADAQQRELKPGNIFSVKGTSTELAAPCRAGDRVLRIKDGKAWKAKSSFAVAFGVGENELTHDVTPLGIKNVGQDGDVWMVTLKNPCGLEMPTGTPVHQNQAGSNCMFLPGAVSAVIPGEWTEFKGEIKAGDWWPGTAYARLVVIGPRLRRGQTANILLMDDFDLRIQPES